MGSGSRDRIKLDLIQHSDALPRPNVFEFNGFRTFLTEWLRYLLSKNKKMSIRSLSKKCGVSAGYFHLVGSGRSGITEKAFKKLSAHFDLTPEEYEFTECLRIIENKHSEEEKTEAFERILRIKEERAINPSESEAYRYYHSWLNVAIREFTRLRSFKADPAWIKKKLQFKRPKKEVEDSLQFLLENGYLGKTDDGKLYPKVKHISVNGEIYNRALKESHKGLLELAKQSLDTIPRDQRYVRGRTLPVSQKSYEKIIEIIQKSFDEIQATEKESGEDLEKVIHVSMSAFPIIDSQGEDND